MNNTNIFIISTMTPDLTSQVFSNLVKLNNDYDTILAFEYNNKQIWITCMSPILQCMAENIIPHADKCLILYHKNDVLGCLRVKNTIQFVSGYNDNIELAAVSLPVLPSIKSLVKKQYDQNGFLRKFFTGKLQVIIKKIQL
jgi:hypothetical protein